MGHTPYGYRIEDGKAVVDEKASEQVKELYSGYLAGLSLKDAAKQAGIDCYHATVSRMLQNKQYLGDEFYPPIIDEETFEKAGVEKQKRAEKLGRIWEPKDEPETDYPVTFKAKPLVQKYDDPYKQAEYVGVSRNVTVIPAIKRIGNNKNSESKPKIRVAAYCRVSTDSEEQASSYDIQIEHYTNYIKKNKEWELAGIFADDGITGTNTKKRDEFNRMIEECMAGNIDMIITKSISRFARNTLDCLKYIRQLKDKNIAVFFEKENINTMDSKGEVLLTIMASLAQQESQSLSQNVKLGIQYRYQQGEVQVNHKRFLGYTKDENKQLVIDPEGAEVVKRIYREYLEGASLLQIARGLEADGILTAAGKAKWRPETLKKILQNEKYIGDALLQKTYTVDFLSKKRVKNNGIVPQYYVENSHEPIIPRDLFMQVQEEMVRRANLRGGKGGKKRVYSSKYALSSIVYCGHCGDIYRRVHWNNRGYKSIVWRCVSRLEEKGSECTAPTINEETLQTAVVKAINELLAKKEPFLSTLQKNIATIFNEENDNATDDIDSKLEELQQQLLIQAKSNNDYEDVADEIYRLRELKKNALVENAEREGKRQRIAEMTDFLNEQSCELEEYDEQLVRRLIEKVTVFDDKLAVEFKSGVEIDVEG